MADSDLPVWSFRANWQEGVTERLSFLTDVLRADEGAEQRRSLRSTPRRGLEADFLLTGPERTFLDLFLHRLGGSEMMIPLYWDIVTLTSATVAGTTDRINFDNTRREFAVGLALLSGPTALDREVVEIAAVDAGGIDLADPTVLAWPRGTKLMPLRRGVFEDVGSPSHKTGGTASLSAQLRFTVANPWTVAADESPVYIGLPVFLDEPNWVDDLTVAFDREVIRLDNETGLPYQVDSLGRAVIGQAHRWFLPSREKLAGFRDLLYRHKGRTGAFWLPTFKHDLRLVNSPGSGATQIEVKNVGYGYTGGPTSGREYIAIKHAGGTILRRVLSVIPGTTTATEKANLDAPLGLALSPGLVRRISFMDTARFDQDEFELTHHGGLDSLTECSAVFRAFKNTRTAPILISFPIPEGAEVGGGCGVDAISDCYEYNPPAPEFEGWYVKIRHEFPVTGGMSSGPDHFLQNLDDGNTIISTDNCPVGGPFGCYDGLVPYGIEYTWTLNDVPVGTNWRHRLQFGFGAVSGGTTGRLLGRRWDDGGLGAWTTILDPTSMGGSFPINYDFTF